MYYTDHQPEWRRSTGFIPAFISACPSPSIDLASYFRAKASRRNHPTFSTAQESSYKVNQIRFIQNMQNDVIWIKWEVLYPGVPDEKLGELGGKIFETQSSQSLLKILKFISIILCWRNNVCVAALVAWRKFTNKSPPGWRGETTTPRVSTGNSPQTMHESNWNPCTRNSTSITNDYKFSQHVLLGLTGHEWPKS